MVTKKVFSVTEELVEKGELVSRVNRMVIEYRVFGILFYKKTLFLPDTRYYEGFTTVF